MSTVRIKYQCGHSLLQTVGETSAAGIGAAVLALQQQDCPACQEREPQTGMDEESAARTMLLHTEDEAKAAFRAYLRAPDRIQFWLLLQALQAYEGAVEDWRQEENR
jgi:hypothetical protein